jgi:hypothetical protein
MTPKAVVGFESGDISAQRCLGRSDKLECSSAKNEAVLPSSPKEARRFRKRTACLMLDATTSRGTCDQLSIDLIDPATINKHTGVLEDSSYVVIYC